MDSHVVIIVDNQVLPADFRIEHADYLAVAPPSDNRNPLDCWIEVMWKNIRPNISGFVIIPSDMRTYATAIEAANIFTEEYGIAASVTGVEPPTTYTTNVLIVIESLKAAALGTDWHDMDKLIGALKKQARSVRIIDERQSSKRSTKRMLHKIRLWPGKPWRAVTADCTTIGRATNKADAFILALEYLSVFTHPRLGIQMALMGSNRDMRHAIISRFQQSPSLLPPKTDSPCPSVAEVGILATAV